MKECTDGLFCYQDEICRQRCLTSSDCGAGESCSSGLLYDSYKLCEHKSVHQSSHHLPPKVVLQSSDSHPELSPQRSYSHSRSKYGLLVFPSLLAYDAIIVLLRIGILIGWLCSGLGRKKRSSRGDVPPSYSPSSFPTFSVPGQPPQLAQHCGRGGQASTPAYPIISHAAYASPHTATIVFPSAPSSPQVLQQQNQSQLSALPSDEQAHLLLDMAQPSLGK